ncbi:MAG: DNRLRE domain-containing protein [Bacteroidetes bacterium]|nr:DNRLRE domain-containing protein [Bacteroidota bacterium]
MYKNLFFRIVILSSFMLISIGGFAQTDTTVTFQPDGTSGKDAILESTNPTTNYGSDVTVGAKMVKVVSTVVSLQRGVFQFDLSGIPKDAYVISAKLTLSSGTVTGTNACYLRRISAGWVESTCNWNTLSGSSITTDQISIPSTTLTTYTVDVSNHVQTMVNVPAINYGWMLQLQNETTAGQFIFSSSDGATASLRPKLEVKYELPMIVTTTMTAPTTTASTDGTIRTSITKGKSPYTYSWSTGATTSSITGVGAGMYTVTVTDANGKSVGKILALCAGYASLAATYQPDALAGKDSYLALGDDGVTYLNTPGPNSTAFAAIRGTSGGWFKERSTIEFDLSHIPTNAIVNSATLTLYGTSHNQLGMSNASYLYRNTTAWGENSVTWATLPATITTGSISLSATSTSTDNKLIDVTSQVQDMISTPSGNKGWTIQLQNETPQSYAAMYFASSDYTVATMRPKLQINYTNPCPTALTISVTPSAPCAGSTVTLSTAANSYITYSWSGSGITSSTTTSAILSNTLTNSQTFTLNAGSCGTKTVQVNYGALPTITLTPSTPSITCTNTAVVITSSTSASSPGYTWSPGGATTSSLSVTSGNTYTLLVKDGITTCTNTKTITVATNTTVPTLTITNSPTITCSSPTVVITSTTTTTTSGASYTWSPSGGTASSASVTTGGTYTLLIKDGTNGCTLTKTVSISTNTTVPTLTITNSPTITCSSPTVVITSTTTTSGATYSWSPVAGSTSSLSVTASGTYSLKVTDPANGCTITKTVSISTNTTTPTLTITNSPTINCTNPSAVLTSTSTTSGVTYTWSPGGANTSTLAVISGGTYTLLAKDPANGCILSRTVTVSSPLSSSAGITDYVNDTTRGQVNLCLMGGTPPYTVAWSGFKYPSVQAMYNKFKTDFAGITLDSTIFKSKLDSLRRQTSSSNLIPGTYSVTVYDQSDSLILFNTVGMSMLQNAAAGVTTATSSIGTRTSGKTIYTYGNGLSISQSGTYVSGSHYYISANHLEFTDNFSLGFEIARKTDAIDVGLRKDSTQIDGTSTDMSPNAGFHFKGDGTYTIIFKGSTIYSGTLNDGDRFMMTTNTETHQLAYYQNETKMTYSDYTNLSSTVGFSPKFVFKSAGGVINGIKIVPEKKYLTSSITTIVTDVSCDNLCSGSINAAGRYILASSPVKYELYSTTSPAVLLSTLTPSGPNNVTFSNLCAGTYTIKYYYTTIFGANGNFSQSATVAFKPNWTHTQGVNVNSTDYSLTKNSTGTVNGQEDAGASSCNALNMGSNGWFEVTAPTQYGANMIGLSNSDPDFLSASIGYKMLIWRFFVIGDTRIYYIPGLTTGVNLGTFTSTDKFRFEKNGSNIKMYQNNVNIGQFTGVTNQSYIADVTMNIINGDVNHPRVSFGCSGPFVYAIPKEKPDGTYYKANSRLLYIKYDEKYIDESLKFNVYDASHTLVNTSSMSTITKKYGNNWLSLDFSSVSGLSTNAYYILEIYNEKGLKEYVRFYTN